ncbi:MAG: fibrillarin-like rRNA/tRNA 2'-O-methyltransferase [Candidatus Bathyarchaeia archaeon]
MSLRVTAHRRFPGVYWATLEDGSKRPATVNLAPGRSVYGERLLKAKGREYRVWDPFRSKLAAAIMKDLRHLPIKAGSRVLYLGAASGTTCSHVSDLIEQEGRLYCVEFSPRSMRELVENLCRHRPNVFPILADARLPERYRSLVTQVDAVYCDIAQPEQAKVLADNCDQFLVPGGGAMLAVKARSIDVARKPAEVFKAETQILERRGFTVKQQIPLEPYDKDHVMVVAEYLKQKS